MDLPIFYLNTLSSTVITLDEETSRHVVQVLRMEKGKKLQLTDGAGNLLLAEIVDPHKKKCTVQVIEKVFIPKKERKVSIGISLLKNNTRFEWFLEKATELGVTEIIPLVCSRTEKQHFRFDKMNQIVISAMMQSKQVWLAKLHAPTRFEDVFSNTSYSSLLIAHCMDKEKTPLEQHMHSPSVQILIGPEGDFTQSEILKALENSFNQVSLGNTRLRTETAGIVAATLLCL